MEKLIKLKNLKFKIIINKKMDAWDVLNLIREDIFITPINNDQLNNLIYYYYTHYKYNKNKKINNFLIKLLKLLINNNNNINNNKIIKIIIKFEYILFDIVYDLNY